jgi:hypothetical protein
MFRVHGDAGGGVHLTILNIAAGGMLVHASDVLTVGTTYEVKFHVLRETVRLTVGARVIHAARVQAFVGNSYLLGLQFIPNGDTHLAEHVQRLIDACLGDDA